MSNAIYEVESYELLRFAKQYASLGDAIQDQLRELLDRGPEDDQGTAMTPGAYEFCHDRLRGFNREIDEALDDMADTLGMTECPRCYEFGRDCSCDPEAD